MSVKKGDKIKVDYTGTFDNGEVFDSSTHGDHSHPLEFEVGSGQVIGGFDDAVIGMEKDEEKEIKIKPGEGYGEYNENLIRKFPREQFPKEQEPKEGMTILLSSPDGNQFPAKIKEVNDKEITLDLNHPLAGKILNFRIKIIEISQ